MQVIKYIGSSSLTTCFTLLSFLNFKIEMFTASSSDACILKCFVGFILFLLSVWVYYQRRAHQNKRKKDIFILGPADSGKTTMFYKLIQDTPQNIYSSIRSYTSEAMIFNEILSPVVKIPIERKSARVHDISFKYFSAGKINEFFLGFKEAFDFQNSIFLLTVDGTQLLNPIYVENFITCTVEFLQHVYARTTTDFKPHIVFVITRSKSPLCVKENYAQEIITERIKSKIKTISIPDVKSKMKHWISNEISPNSFTFLFMALHDSIGSIEK